MATLYQPEFEVLINGFNVSNTIKPHLISISIEEVFNTSFAPTKLEMIFHAKYIRSSSWRYKDTVRVRLWWKESPLFLYESPTFYVDYIDDIKDNAQTFRVSALAADPTLGFNYGVEEIKYTNTTIQTAITNFGSLFGLTVSQNLASNVFLGTIKNVFSSPTPSFTSVFADFESYADMLKYICETYGYYGDLRGRNLRLLAVESAFTNNPRFLVPPLDEVNSFDAKQSYTPLYKQYNLYYTSGSSLLGGFVQPPMAAQLNEKQLNIDYADAYFGVNSASRRLLAEFYQDLIEGFEVTVNVSAQPEFRAGDIFLLDANYGLHEGFYRCTRCIHRVDGNGWVTEISGFPLNKTQNDKAYFIVGYQGNTTIPGDDNPLTINTNLTGTLTALTGSQLDEFADSIFPDYNTPGLGSIFISEGNKPGNTIRPDIAFCLALVVTQNFTFTPLVSVNNPGELFNSAGNAYASFSTWNLGIRAMIQHLFAYARATGSPADPIVDPRFSSVVRGSATTLFQLTGNWNSNLDLDYMVRVKMRKLYERFYPDRKINII